jgi:high affinity sulfate transporter 1
VDAAQFGKIGLSWIPILRWMRSYDASTFRLDLVAGVSLAAFVIPQSLAYASLAQLPPITGLYCCLAAGMGYAIFGTCRQIAVGPTSAIAILIATSAAALGGGDPARAIAVASALALFAGVVCIAGRGLGLANAAYFISDPILTGFKAGAGLYIASTQLPKLFGIEGVSGNFFTRTWHVISALPSSHVPTLLMGLAAIALFIVLQRRLPGRPTTLVVVAASIIFMSLWGPASTGIKIIGELAPGLPAIRLPNIDLSDISALVPTAFACFLLAYGESISVARSFAQKHGYDIDPGQELTALGAANIATGLTQGFPVAGGMSQTAVNDMGGASTPFALVVTSAAIALTLLFFAGFFHNLPQPVLAAIVLIAASHLVRVEDLRMLRAASRQDFRIAMLAMAGVLLLGLLDGLLLAAVGSLVLLIARASRPPVVVLGRNSVGQYVNRARYPDAVEAPGVLVVRSAGGWFYFNADYIRRSILDLAASAPAGLKLLVIDLSIVPAIDTSAATTLGALVRALRERGTEVVLAEMRDDVLESLNAIDAEKNLGHIDAHRTIGEAVDRATSSGIFR